MNYTNQMLSSDNMGYASYLLEQDKNPGELPGQVRAGPLAAAAVRTQANDGSPVSGQLRGRFLVQ